MKKKATHFPEFVQVPFPQTSNKKESRKIFLRSAYKIWAEAQRAAHPHPPPHSKGGRPSKQDKVFDLCWQIWAGWGQKWPRKRKAQQTLVEAVQSLYAKKFGPIGEDTVRKHVRAWIDGNLSLAELPASFLIHEVFPTPEEFVEHLKLMEIWAVLFDGISLLEQGIDDFKRLKKIPPNTLLRDFPMDDFVQFLNQKYPHRFSTRSAESAEALRAYEAIKRHFSTLKGDQQKRMIRKVANALSPK